MRILFLGLNYRPEAIGIAIYSAGLCEYLAEQGHDVTAVVAKPYYPDWRVFDGWRGFGFRSGREEGIRVIRCPLYVPARPSGVKRLVHHLSFAVSALFPLIWNALRRRPDLVVTVAPSLIAAPIAWLAAKLTGARSWLHVQDFEVEAAFATGLLDGSRPSARLARAFEHRVLGLFDTVSSISPEMCARLAAIGIPAERIHEFRNWADIDAIRPMDSAASPYRQRWGITTPHVALYSGNIANKQGIEIVVEAARRLAHRQDLTFVICGQGPNREALQASAAGVANIRFHDLQPVDALGSLLGLATIHLLPQKASAADLVLPSKLTNMLGSGKPIVATAAAGTCLAREVMGCGLVVEPENAEAFAAGIARLVDEPWLHAELAGEARGRAELRWSMEEVLKAVVERMNEARSSEY